jgi:hypothetical protein
LFSDKVKSPSLTFSENTSGIPSFEYHSVSNTVEAPPQKHNIITKNLQEKYATGIDAYNLKVINDIISNEPTRIVAVFKDYLLIDDVNDFLTKFYTTKESYKKLSHSTKYFSKYCTVFANYINLEEK